MDKKIKVLFLCTGNSCRSQMAEGWTNYLKSNEIQAYSAGIETHGLNPNAVAVMKEAGIDITNQKSENIKEYINEDLDYVITVCDSAHENCPIFPRKCTVIHVGFQDPPKLASEVKENGGTAEQQLDCYREVRDQIKEFVLTLPQFLQERG